MRNTCKKYQYVICFLHINLCVLYKYRDMMKISRKEGEVNKLNKIKKIRKKGEYNFQ